MMLQPTKYKNTFRTITGLNNPVFNNDVILLCDTTLAPVSINLLELAPDHWSTVYKLYIEDRAGNASANNITINAPAGYTINGQPSLTINVDNATCVIRVANNEAYIASLSYGVSAGQLAILDEGVLLTAQAQSINFTGANVVATATGNDVTVNIQTNFISVTFAQLTTLINTNAIIPDQDYEIVDAEFGSTPIIPTKVYVQGITNDSVSIAGNGIFYNADYQTVGDYSGIVGFNSQLGIWDQALVPVQNDVVIWNNFHYINLTGVNGLNAPSIDLVNWLVLPLTNTNGYILEVDKVEYNQNNNWIMSRRDRRYNFVERMMSKTENSLNFFKWGDDLVFFNSVEKFSVFNNCNVKILTSISYNEITNSEVLIRKGTGYMYVQVLSQNTFNNSFFDSHNKLDFLQRNFAENSQLVVDAVSFRDNRVHTSAVTISNSLGLFSRNVFVNSTIDIQSNTLDITRNTVNTGLFRVLNDNLGEIKGNLIESGGIINITTNSAGSIVNFNNVSQSSVLEVTTNNSTILNNTISGESRLDVVTNNGTIGDTKPLANGSGNYILGHSTVNITTNDDVFSGNRFDDYCTITVANNSNFFQAVEAYKSDVILVNNANGISNINLKSTQINIATPLLINDGEAVTGNGSIAYTIDCADPSVYDLGTQTLTIPLEVSAFAGIIKLTNAGGLGIIKIANLNSRWLTTISNDAGTTTFNTTAVGLAVATDIISSFAPLTALPVVYRANGGDSILFRATGNLASVEQANIYS